MRTFARWILGSSLLLSAHAASAQPASAGRDTDERGARIEPSALETVKAALAFAALQPERIASLRTRAEWKNAVPVLAVKAGISNSTIGLTKFNQNFSATEAAESEDARGDALDVEVSGQWNLPGLVYNAEALDVNALVAQPRELAAVVLETWAARKRLVLEVQFGGAMDAATWARRDMEIERHTAFLDALTGEAFSRRARRAPGRAE